MNRLIRRTASTVAAAAIALVGQPALLASVLRGADKSSVELPFVSSRRAESRQILLPRGVQPTPLPSALNPAELKFLLEGMKRRLQQRALEMPRLRTKMQRGIERVDRAVRFVAILAATDKDERHELIQQLPSARRVRPRPVAPAVATSESPDGSVPAPARNTFDLCEDEEGWDECATEQDGIDAEILAAELDAELANADSDVSGAQSDMEQYCNQYPSECGGETDEDPVASGPSDVTCVPPQNQLLQCAAAVGGAVMGISTAGGKVWSLWNLAQTAVTVTARSMALAAGGAIVAVAATVIIVAAAADLCGSLPPPIEPAMFRED